jgi:molybdopterin synthase catalytic subunit
MTNRPIEIQVCDSALDPETLTRQFRQDRPTCGALVTFLGLMRELQADQRLVELRLEHYPGMTEKSLAQIACLAMDRWPVEAILIAHRVGSLLPQDPIVLVAVASPHRAEAFQASEFLMDELKTRAPFWKQEIFADGSSHWVDARHSDTQAARRWKQP